MRIAEDIIHPPIYNRKSNDDMADGKYTFIVDYRAKKTEIKRAVKSFLMLKS